MTAQEFRYTHYMTLKEWKQFKKNYENDGDNKNISIKEYIEFYNNSSFGLFISLAFEWKNTPEGYEYWDNIYYRTEPLNFKSCK